MTSQLRSAEFDTRPVPEPPSTSVAPQDVGLLVLRLTLGVILAAHGTQKLFGWFGGNGIDGTGRFFQASGYPAPEFMATVAGLIETGGGIALALGLLTPLAAAAVLGNMVNAVAVGWAGGFFAPTGIEFPLLLACAAGALALSGPGRFSVDRSLPVLRVHRLGYGASAVALALITAGIFLAMRN
ncbi:DoxX family protein [Streptomyces sp. NPDC088387]|uniref:DoxX family protein n=1 Tax=Streptomyces sp. NPDC088387 TaxID=3365859 RepID=UPI00381EA3CB